jgi:hypothetical protein
MRGMCVRYACVANGTGQLPLWRLWLLALCVSTWRPKLCCPPFVFLLGCNPSVFIVSSLYVCWVL